MARSKITIVHRQSGYRAIRTAPKVMKMLNEKAHEVASRASGSGPGEFTVHEAQVTGGRVRGRAAVVTTTYEAMKSQARNHTLEKALGGGPDG